MEIIIGFGNNSNSESNSHNQNEYNYLNIIIEKISKYFDKDSFHIESYTNDYLTLQYKEIDIARIKYTERAKWISIMMTNECNKENTNNPLFEKQVNKNQSLWKSDFKDDINPYLPFLLKACEWLDKIK